ncbi:hypothetical protein KA005_57380, partial [bacterium]|nr:hypothetical protein [bacterium]
MNNSETVRSAFARQVLTFMPPIVQENLTKNPDFLKDYSLDQDAVLTLDKGGVEFAWPSILSGIRQLLSNGQNVTLEDKKGRKWELQNRSKKGEVPNLVLCRSKTQIRLPDYSALAPDQATRLLGFSKAISRVNLPSEAAGRWRNILTERPFQDYEHEEYIDDLNATPIFARLRILGALKELEERASVIPVLIPPTEPYFERLVGKYDGSASIQEYASGSGKRLFQQLSEWDPEDGFLLSLLLSSHPILSENIVADKISGDFLSNALDMLIEHGDRISQVGAIEVGLRVLPDHPEIEPKIVQLITQILEDNAEDETSEFQLLSALFIMVYGEISRTCLLSESPPFYRRLAALTHAALIHDQIKKTDIDRGKFCELAKSNWGAQFYFRSLADMRLEPRWNPDLVEAAQLKADFIGRIMLVAQKYEPNIRTSPLYKLILGDNPLNEQDQIDYISPFLPGPLEGIENPHIKLPKDYEESIKEQLTSEELTPSSFVALVNSAMLYGSRKSHAELAVGALKAGRHHLANVEDRLQLRAILIGLSSVAAIARNPSLAN